MRKSILSLCLVFVGLVTVQAQEKDSVSFRRHEIRVGWGDMLYETAVYRNTPSKFNYGYTGHIFGEYQYSFNDWFGLGFEADFESVRWDEKGSPGHNFYNLTFMPTARFTYYRKGILTMYSGLGVGLTVNGGSDTDYKGRFTACAPMLNITAYGISVAWKQFFAAFELGGLNALVGKNEVYMAGSRLMSVSMGVRL